MGKKTDDESYPAESPSQDKTARHAGDQFLRSHGFRIFARRPAVPALWERRGNVYDEHTARRIADEERRAALARLESQLEGQ